MRRYETTFIVTPVLSDGEIKQAAESYISHIKKAGAEVVHVDEMGLKQLAYPIKKRNSGVYYSVEYSAENGEMIDGLELAFRRDERIMRFLTIKLDKFGIKYNEDKRSGVIGKRKKERADAKAAAAAAAAAELEVKKEANKAAAKKKKADALAAAEAAKPAVAEEAAPAVEAKEAVVEAVKEEATPVVEAKEAVVEAAPAVEAVKEEAAPAVEEAVTEAAPVVEEAPAVVEETIETVADTPVDVAGEITLDDDILGDLGDLNADS